MAVNSNRNESHGSHGTSHGNSSAGSSAGSASSHDYSQNHISSYKSLGDRNTAQGNMDVGRFDVFQVAKDAFHIFLRMWWLPLVLALALSILLCYRAKSSYSPSYKASATFTVSVVGVVGSSATYYSQETAEQLSKTFPSILTSGILGNLICEDLGVTYLPASISAHVDGSTALFTIETVASDPDVAYRVLKSAIKEYPKVANFVVGNTGFNLISEPSVPTEPINSIAYKDNIVNGCITGFAIAGALAVLLAVTRKTVRNADDLKAMVNLRCIGNLPYERTDKRNKNKGFASIAHEDSSRNFSDAIRLIRTRIEKSAKEHHEKVILFASSVPGEGKTTVSVNTAISLAEKGNRIVLIDCDIRKPSTIGGFNDLKKDGLVDYLLAKAELPDILSKQNDHLFVINGIKITNNAAELLRTPRMHKLIESLKRDFDFIILDSPPSAIMADAQALAELADSIVYIVCQDYTRKNQIIDGINNLSNVNTRFIGYVLNNASSTGTGYGYGKYSKYSKYAGYGRYGRSAYGKYGSYGAYSRISEDKK